MDLSELTSRNDIGKVIDANHIRRCGPKLVHSEMKLTDLPNGRTVATIEGDTHISKWVIESGRLDHDQNMLPLLRPFIPVGGTVVDIGAFIGDHTVFYAECVGDLGAVLAFEPNPLAYECLEFNTRGLSRVVAINGAASDKAERIDLATDENAGATHAREGTTVGCMPLDDLDFKYCDFIKIDCEGMEPKALKGAERTIKTLRPVMLIEVNESALARQGFTPMDIFAFLTANGYTYRNIYAEQPMTGEQFDIICTP